VAASSRFDIPTTPLLAASAFSDVAFPFRHFSDEFFDVFGLILEDEAMSVVGDSFDGGKIKLAFWPGNARAVESHVPDFDQSRRFLSSLYNKCLFTRRFTSESTSIVIKEDSTLVITSSI
jgi:hypothetical protein